MSAPLVDPRFAELLPPLSDDEYRSLRDDVAANGVLVPVVLDERGVVLDGHHRLRAAAELGIASYPSLVVAGLSEDEKLSRALTLNVARRHLGSEERRRLVATLRERGWSARRIADETAIPRTTVRRDVEEVGHSAHVDTVEGRDGKHYPARRPVVVTKDTGERNRALRALADVDPELLGDKPLDVRRVERIAREASRLAAASAPLPTTTPDGVDLRHGDFAEVLADVRDVDAIVTDPPWRVSDRDVWDRLGEWAASALRPGGVLVAYAGTMSLPDAVAGLGRHLGYVWQAVVTINGGSEQVWARKVLQGYRPVLVYARPPYTPRNWLFDRLTGDAKGDKEFHDWGQAVGPFRTLLEVFTEPGELVVDPFLGGGTTGVAAIRTGRRFLGAELDGPTFAVAASRLAAELEDGRP